MSFLPATSLAAKIDLMRCATALFFIILSLIVRGATAGSQDPGDPILQRVREMSTDQARELLAAIAVQLGVTLGGEGAADPEPRYGT